MRPRTFFTSPLEGEVESLRFSEGFREGGKPQTLLVRFTPLPNPPPQGGREHTVFAATSVLSTRPT
jgi:hypothetical protein